MRFVLIYSLRIRSTSYFHNLISYFELQVRCGKKLFTLKLWPFLFAIGRQWHGVFYLGEGAKEPYWTTQ